MRIPQHLIDEIRARLPLSELVGRRVTWDARKSQPRKGDLWACCPFHAEKTPSFHVDDRKGFYHCFGCGASGDHFRFLGETEGLSFGEAAEQLADLAGVTLPAPDPRTARRQAEQASLQDVMEMACRFFEAEYRGPSGVAARTYVERRGFSPATADTFRVGLALNARDALKRHLASRGVDERQMLAAGLLIRPDDGRPSYDRFRDRLIIPIESSAGRVIAFGGRSLDPAREPKYLNSPETELFHKSDVLFNARRAREAARKEARVIVVEGYLDVIALHQAGIGSAVASLGTALTDRHLENLWRFADEPLLCFDGDRAGRAAAERAIDRILPVLGPGRSVNVVFLPEGRDPDDIVQSGGAAAFEAAIAARTTLVDALWARETGSARADTPERRAALEARLETVASAIADPSVRQRYAEELRNRVWQLFRAAGRRGPGAARIGAAARVPDAGRLPPGPARNDNLAGTIGTERLVLGLCIEYPALLEQHFDRLASIHWRSQVHARFASALLETLDDGPPAGPAELLARLPEDCAHAVAELHGSPDGPPAARLRQRFGVLNLRPSEHYVARCFAHFLDALELAEAETELADLTRLDSEAVSPQSEHRLLSLMRDLGARRHTFEEDERALADEASAARKSAMKMAGSN